MCCPSGASATFPHFASQQLRPLLALRNCCCSCWPLLTILHNHLPKYAFRKAYLRTIYKDWPRHYNPVSFPTNWMVHARFSERTRSLGLIETLTPKTTKDFFFVRRDNNHSLWSGTEVEIEVLRLFPYTLAWFEAQSQIQLYNCGCHMRTPVCVPVYHVYVYCTVLIVAAKWVSCFRVYDYT
jgi:hypothetical protein